MVNPKRRTSKARRDNRRSHWKLSQPNLVSCPQCHTLKAPHIVCKECGYYGGREVLKEVEA